MSDLEQDLSRLAGGDREAADRVCTRYSPALHRKIRAMLSPSLRRRYDTADLAQSVIYQALRKLPDFEYRGEAAFLRWLTVLAENQVRMKFRKLVDAKGQRRERTNRGEVAPGRGPTPLGAVVAAEEARAARELLRALDRRSRAVVELRCWEDLTFPEIAECLSLPSPAAARMVFARALTRLRDDREAAAVDEVLGRIDRGWVPSPPALREEYPTSHHAIRQALALKDALSGIAAD